MFLDQYLGHAHAEKLPRFMPSCVPCSLLCFYTVGSLEAVMTTVLCKWYNASSAVTSNCFLGMCGNRISVRFWFLKTRTKAKRSNPKFQFPLLFSKPKLSHTNSQYLSHSHKALSFFTLRTQDSGMIGII